MKQKDILLIVVIAIVSAVASFLISNKIFVTPDNRSQQVEAVDPITPVFTTPDHKYFNQNSIDPTLQTQISNGNNQNPFNGTSQ